MSKIFTTLSLILVGLSSMANNTNQDSSHIVLKGATLLDMISNTGKEGTVVINGDKITVIDYTDSYQIPKDSVIYNLEGKYIMPGLIDSHVHITHGSFEDAKKHLETALKHGVTGVRDMGGDGRMLTLLKRNMQIGEDKGPDIFFSTIIAGKKFFKHDPRPAQVALGADSGQVSWQWAIDEDTNFEHIISQTKGIGATAIKIYTDVNKPLMNKVAKEAKKQGLKVWAHAAIAPTRPSDVSRAGADVMSHAGDFLQYEIVTEIKDRYAFSSRDEAAKYRSATDSLPIDSNNKKIKKLLTLMKNNNSHLDATLWVYNNREDKSALKRAQKATKLAFDSGVKIGAGSDNMISPKNNDINIHNELSLLVQAGLPNIDVLRAATIINAEGLGKQDEIGSIEQGKLANLVVLNANPLTDIANTRDLKYVIKRGKIYDGVSSMAFAMQILDDDLANKYPFVDNRFTPISKRELFSKLPDQSMTEVYYENGEKVILANIITKLMAGEMTPIMFVDENKDYRVLVIKK